MYPKIMAHSLSVMEITSKLTIVKFPSVIGWIVFFSIRYSFLLNRAYPLRYALGDAYLKSRPHFLQCQPFLVCSTLADRHLGHFVLPSVLSIFFAGVSAIPKSIFVNSPMIQSPFLLRATSNVELSLRYFSIFRRSISSSDNSIVLSDSSLHLSYSLSRTTLTVRLP